MKKLVLLLSFVFALGLFSVSAQTPTKKEVKTEKAVKPAKKAPVKKATHKSAKKNTKKTVAPSK